MAAPQIKYSKFQIGRKNEPAQMIWGPHSRDKGNKSFGATVLITDPLSLAAIREAEEKLTLEYPGTPVKSIIGDEVECPHLDHDGRHCAAAAHRAREPRRRRVGAVRLARGRNGRGRRRGYGHMVD